MSNPPVPTEIKRKTGNPSHRPLPAVVNVAGKVTTLATPSHLADGATEVWNELIPQLAAVGLLDGVDGILLEALCTHVARAREAALIIEQDGMFQATKRGGLTLHPAVRVERESWEAARKLGESFALTPVARTRLGLALYKGKTLQQELESKLS